MISFDTFSGPRRLREAELDSAGLLTLAELPTPAPQLFPPLPDPPDGSSSDENDDFYESQEDDEDCDLFHEKDNVTATASQQEEQEQEQVSGGRIRQLVELLTLQSRNVEDTRSALVNKLLGVVKVHDLLLSRATEEQIVNAANDAITDEILASVDEEERRRQQHQVASCVPEVTTSARRFAPGQLSPFRVLELVNVLDSTTDAASKVRDRVLEKIPQVLPPPAAALVWRSLDKVGDADLILRKTLQRIGVWGGHSVVPARILKYMRLLMHHEVSTNAFSVVVRFDPRPSHWELQRPGMVSPRSLPSSPTLNQQVRKRMGNYTLQTLLGARDKLHQLVAARRKFHQRLSQDEQPRTNDRQKQSEQREQQSLVVSVDA
ncbi:hypothetical protein BBO99_00004698 [Phytophthora kernoviae]|uniref:Uncharacterized protein n=2 Tax=Phytophthora kernoviae TaxID=325452 RepID=A0A421GQD3_9STRA|nr:hypothetical protein G195_008521 [Phytophthora kernoviae 00238/432]KAG2520430.1 hypothetical protein JM18_007102 [Phytophthora kernoviae]RLN37027.1 hypothetical protein BBI17_004902 [Phytophthora kernoviae]RLN80167.1 hypothetical protein BBO99_00004698 [Phytophthora kernoviae]